jgi:phosphatidylglycerol:prolipoprotein diacylglycerol transferase
VLTIPYFEPPSIGTFEPWGLLVATGLVIAIAWAVKRAQRFDLDVDALTSMAIWVVIGGLVGARLAHVFLYHWSDFENDLPSIFKVWQGGLSSYGGFVGGISAGVYFLKKRGLNLWAYGDVAVFSCLPGWTVGRMGCFVIHDHPGRTTDFFLGAEMKLAVIGSEVETLAVRHDLGLYDGILTFFIFLIFLWLDRRPRWSGMYMALICILYSLPRFFLDFLRATDLSWSDTRYAGLTPAQYGSIMLLILGGWIFWAREQDAS